MCSMDSESEKWQCESCTFVNEATCLVCAMCLKEYKQVNANDDQWDFLHKDFLTGAELGLNAAPEIAQPAVATVSAATAVTTIASKPIAQPFAAATAANTRYTGVIPVARSHGFSNSAAFPRTIPGTMANTYNSYASTYPVNAEPVRYTGPFTSKTVKYNPYSVTPDAANNAYANGARLTTTPRLIRIAVTVTTSSQNVNVIKPVTAATTRLRVINPRCNPSYFEPDLVTVTSSVATVPAVNPFGDSSCNTSVPARMSLLHPSRPASDAFNTVTSTTLLVSSSTSPTFTSSSNFGAMAQPSSYSNISFASFAPQPSHTETPLTFPTPSASATFGDGASNFSVAPLGATYPNSIYNSSLNYTPFNSATAVAQNRLPQTSFNFRNDDNSANSYASTSNAPTVRSVVTAVPALKGAARVTTAPFATDGITGWTCTYCTFINDNLLLVCALCDTKKPNEPLVQPVPVDLAGTTNGNADTAKDKNAHFECPLCYLLFAQAEGIRLQNCGHIFCKNCLRDVINYSAEVRLQCPHKVRGMVCNSLMTAQEVGLILNLEYTEINARPTQPNTSSAIDFIDLCSDTDNDDDSRANIGTVAGVSCIATENPPKIGKEINYQELLELEKEVLIKNIEPFDCRICMTEQEPGEGVIIRDCLHTFCRECLKQAIKLNTEAVMQCPYGDGTTRCESMLQDREIRALVDADVFEKHLKRSITEAENKTQNSFHCKTVDCIGWCEYEDDVTVFPCPVCFQTNCINCKAIHTGLDCKQYQIKVELNSASNLDDAKTYKMLQDMLEKGAAMRCPKCQIILSKVAGCDWLCCSSCKTEICWVTRGPRWGPRGRGDTSGGCRCNLRGGKLCHPKCGNCH